MALSTNQVAGLISGFDWRSMVDRLIDVEHRRVDLVESEKSGYESRLAEWRTVNTKLLALKTSVEQIDDEQDFALFAVSLQSDSSNLDADEIMSVSAGSGAFTGTYTVKVTGLATAQKLSSNPFTSRTEALGSSYAGQFLIKERLVTVSGDDSLNDVAAAINRLNSGDDPTGVTASIISYASGDFRLILTSDSTGEEGINIKNASSLDLVQKFGFKDKESAVIKNEITQGAQSDAFSSQSVAIKSLLGLSDAESSTGTLAIDGTPVSIDLSTQSLADIKNAIDSAMLAAGKSGSISASVVSEKSDDGISYRLQIEGTQSFIDEKNILNTLGILDYGSADVEGVVSANALTENGDPMDVSTLLTEIDGYISYTSGDKLVLSGTKTDGTSIGPVDFSISTSTSVEDLVGEIESLFGDVKAYVTSDGNLRVDDLSGGGNLSVSITDSISNGNLSFGAFSAASARKRELLAGADASLEIDGVSVTSSSNLISDVIPGLALELKKADANTTLTLTVSNDTDGIASKIEGFVSSYNDILSYITTQFSYDQENDEPVGVLFGDGTLQSVKSEITSVILSSVWGAADDLSSLSLAGIENVKDENGEWRLEIDESVLKEKLEQNFEDVKKLFVGMATTDSSDLSYIAHTGDTKKGDYSVFIYRAPTLAVETGSVDLSSGGVSETLTITQGLSEAAIEITSSMDAEDIKNQINSELSAEYEQILVGSKALYSDASASTPIRSDTFLKDIYDSSGVSAGLASGDTISFSGTLRDGSEVSGSFLVEDIETQRVSDLLLAISETFADEVSVEITSSGKIMVTDESVGYSQIGLSVDLVKNLDFGSVSTANPGGQRGRYKMPITASTSAGRLVLESDDFGSSFSIDQDTSDGNYDQIIYSTTRNTTAASSGHADILATTTWDDIYGAGVENGDTITIAGKARDGVTDISGSFTITDVSSGTVQDLLDAIGNAYSAGGTSVSVFLRNGSIYVEDLTSGASSISLVLTANNEGGGSLDLGSFASSTKRDLDLGLINGDVTGYDVAGSIGGESATGSGRTLTGDSQDGDAYGLAVSYTGDQDAVEAGQVRLTIGIAEQLSRLIERITDPLDDGYVAVKQDSLQSRIDSIADRIASMEARLDRRMEMMINRFVRMELAISRIQSQSNWLSGQIQALFK